MMAKGDLTKAKQISPETKKKVWERQNGRSVVSGFPISVEMCCCHFIGRGEKSGVGYEWNVVGLTTDEHRLLDENKPLKINGRIRYSNAEMQTIIHNHLVENYEGWALAKCSYHKYWKEEDYDVKRRKKI